MNSIGNNFIPYSPNNNPFHTKIELKIQNIQLPKELPNSLNSHKSPSELVTAYFLGYSGRDNLFFNTLTDDVKKNMSRLSASLLLACLRQR